MADSGPIQRFYDRWAGPYDLIANAPPVRGWRRRAVDALALAGGETVVEMGCGTGVNLPLLRERVGASGQVIGVDLTSGMLDRARGRVDRGGWENVHLVHGDATAPPIDGDVDAVFASFVVGMFDDPEVVVEEWMRLLGRGGRIALLDAGPSNRPVAIPLNLGFRAFTRLTAPASRTSTTSPAIELGQRVRAAHGAVRRLTRGSSRERFAIGFLRLTGGRFG